MKLLKENSNSYMPAFYYMNLKFPFYDSPMVLYNLSKRNLASFIHEYIHFLQDITTYWGLNNAYVYSEYIHGAINQVYEYPKGDFYVPLQLSDNVYNIRLNQSFVEECTGDYDEIDKLFITDINVRKEKVKYPDFYVKKIGACLFKVTQRENTIWSKSYYGEYGISVRETNSSWR